MKHLTTSNQARIVLKNVFTFLFIFGLSFNLMAQSRYIRGTVIDATDKSGIPGATVRVLGTAEVVGTVTDIEGGYTLSVPSGATALSFSFIGMTTKEVALGSSDVINATLESGAIAVEELVVVGFGRQKKETVVGSVVSAKGEDLLKAGGVTTISEALSGILPGVTTMQAAGQPGSTGADILIRGQSTWGSNTPLFLVDGVEREFNDVDPNEIASISVLKDASATAVFGVKAANGVILITTKRGTTGKAKVSASANWGLKIPSSETEYAIDYADNLRYYNVAAMNDGQYAKLRPQSLIDTWDDPNRDTDFYSYTNWIEELLGKGYSQQYNVNISGGNDLVKYFTSVGYTYDGDIFDLQPQDDLDPRTYQHRYNWRSNLDFQLTETTKFSVNTSGDFKDWNGNYLTNQSDAGVGGLYLSRLYNQFMVGAPAVMSDGRLGSQELAEEPNLRGRMEREAQYRKRTIKMYNDFMLEQKIGETLTFRGKLSYDILRQYNSNITHSKTNNPVIYWVPDYQSETFNQKPTNRFFIPASVGNENLGTYNRSLYYQLSLDYNKTFAEDHEVAALALFSRRSYRGNANFPKYEESWVGRLTYGYKRKYLVDINGAYNGSENWAPGLRFGFFPSIAPGWVVSEENFFKDNVSFMNFFKIRYSIGLVGNDRLPSVNGVESRFAYIPSYSSVGIPNNNWDTADGDGYPGGYGTFTGNDPITSMGDLYVEGKPANLEATWETAVKQNFAFDMAFLGDRLQATTEFYNETRDGILMTRRTIPPWFGNEFPDANIGKAKNHGFDVELKWNDKVGQNFSYWLTANLSMTENRVIERDDPVATPEYQKLANKPIGFNSGFLDQGLYQSWDDVYNTTESSFSKLLMPGDMGYVDYNGDGIIDNDDKVVIENPSYAARSYAFSLGATYKQFSITAMLNGVFNISKGLSDAYLWEYKQMGDLNYRMLNNEMLDYWSPTYTGSHPTLHLSSNGHNDQTSTYTVRSSNFLRLRNVELKYKFTSEFMHRIRIFETMEVYVNGNNLWTFTSLPDMFDPEAKKLEVYPITKRYNLGMRLSF